MKFSTKNPSRLDPKPIFAARISNGILGSTRSLVKKFLGHMRVVKSIGGWKMLCLTETAKIGIQREAFLKAFKVFGEREKDLRALTETEKDLLKGFSGKLIRGID